MRAKGRNLAESSHRSAYSGIFEKYEQKKSCIFLSHVRADKDYVRRIGEYITDAGLDIYLDINDSELQRAAEAEDHEAITKCLEIGITNSSHILCIVSERTKRSWWVPYEVGYAKRSETEIATLLLKDVNDIPSYLSISEVLKGVHSLHKYIERICKETTPVLERYSTSNNNPNLIAPSSAHPLSDVLKWNM